MQTVYNKSVGWYECGMSGLGEYWVSKKEHYNKEQSTHIITYTIVNHNSTIVSF